MRAEDRSWTPADRPPSELAAPPLRLRRWRDEHLAPLELEIGRSREHLARWLAWAATTERASLVSFLLGSQASFAARTDFGYALEEPGGDLVGGAGLHARIGRGALEIGYWVAVGATRRGYATAAARALTDAALRLPDVTRVEIHCDEANVASAAVPRKLGFRLDRVEPQDPEAPGETGRSQVWVLER